MMQKYAILSTMLIGVASITFFTLATIRYEEVITEIKDRLRQQVVIDSLNIQIMQKDSLIKDQAALIENYQLLYELGE